MSFVTVRSAEGPETPYQISQELLDARPADFVVIGTEVPVIEVSADEVAESDH